MRLSPRQLRPALGSASAPPAGGSPELIIFMEFCSGAARRLLPHLRRLRPPHRDLVAGRRAALEPRYLHDSRTAPDLKAANVLLRPDGTAAG